MSARATLWIGAGALLALAVFVGWSRSTRVVPEHAPEDRLRAVEERAPALELGPPLAPSSEERIPIEASGAAPSASSAASTDALRISGTVLRPDGTPPRLGDVRFVWDDDGRMCEVHGTPGTDGKFELDLPAPGVVGDLLVSEIRHECAPVARLGVRAGTSGLELRLGPAAFFRLEARDQNGESREVGQPEFEWELAGHPSPDHTNTGARLARSPVPFYLDICPRDCRRVALGPFDPAQIGDRLILSVERYPRLRGRVLHSDEGVPGATVELTHPEPQWEGKRRDPWYSAVSLDAEGRFEFCPMFASHFELQARAPGLGESAPLAIDFDGQHDIDGVTLELTHAFGALEGRVTLPNGHTPAEICLVSSSAHGYRSLRTDGTYRLDDLAAGLCQIEIGENDAGTQADTWIPRGAEGHPAPPSWLASAPILSTEIRSGTTGHLDIDLASAPLCRLRGVIRIDGKPPRIRQEDSMAWTMPRVRLEGEDDGRAVSACTLGADGSFQLGTDIPGRYRLRVDLELEGAREATWKVSDLLRIAAGERAWSLDVVTGSLRILPHDTQRPLRIAPAASWSGPGELCVEAWYPEYEEASGSRLHRFVPAGVVHLGGHEAKVPDLECEIRPGETTEIRWPQ